MAAKAAYKEVSEKIRKKAKKAKSPPWRRSETTLDEDDVEGALVTLRRLRVELFHRPYTVIDIPGDDEDNRKDEENHRATPCLLPGPCSCNILLSSRQEFSSCGNAMVKLKLSTGRVLPSGP